MVMAQEPASTSMVAKWSWRCRIGLFIIVIGDVILPAFAFVVPFLDLPRSLKVGLTSILLIGGPEVMMIVGVALAGKEGYAALKATLQKIWQQVKPPQRVSPMRYRLGVIIFIASGLPMWIIAYLHAVTTVPLDHQTVLWILIGSDFAFLISFFIAGGEFWEKLKQLFSPVIIQEDELLAQATALTGIKEKSSLVRLGLEALIAKESAKGLAALGGTEKKLEPIPRRRLG